MLKELTKLRFLRIICLSVLCFVTLALPTQAKFTDVPKTNPYHTMLEQLAKDGIITGYENGTFKPSAVVTRAHVAAILNRALILEPIRPAITFADVTTQHKYYTDIQTLYRAGIIDGYQGNFQPNAPLTRGHLAKILTNVFQLTEQPTDVFSDVAADDQYNSYIGALVSTGATTGYPDKTYRPKVHVTRQHFAVFFYRLHYNDTLPLSPVYDKNYEKYLDSLTKIQTKYAMFYSSPSVPYEYAKAYADAFTDEEILQAAKYLAFTPTQKARFLVLDFDKDTTRYTGELLDDPFILGWINSFENVVVLTTNLQPRPYKKPDVSLLNHEYFHWLLLNEFKYRIHTVWVEEALADNIGALFAENKTKFIDTTLFKDYVKIIKEEGFANEYEPYSEESIVAIALLEDKYGTDALREYLQLTHKMSDTDAFYKVYNMRYRDMFQLVKDYVK